MRPGEALEQRHLGERRHRLLGADHGDRDDRDAGAHRGLHEAAAAEAAQPVAVLVELLGRLRALGEDEHELLLVVEQAVHVGRMRGDAADLGDEHAEEREALEEVLDGQVQLARARVLLLDRLGDHRRVGRQRAGVVGDEQGAAGGRDVLDPLDLAAEPVVVEERDERLVEQALEPLGAAPVGDRPVRLDRRQVVAQVRAAAAPGAAPVMRAPARGCAASSSQSSPQITSSVSHSSRFHGCSSVAAVMPASSARSRLSGESSISTSIPISWQRAILS